MVALDDVVGLGEGGVMSGMVDVVVGADDQRDVDGLDADLRQLIDDVRLGCRRQSGRHDVGQPAVDQDAAAVAEADEITDGGSVQRLAEGDLNAVEPFGMGIGQGHRISSRKRRSARVITRPRRRKTVLRSDVFEGKM